jgi:hypothetical protein
MTRADGWRWIDKRYLAMLWTEAVLFDDSRLSPAMEKVEVIERIVV